MHLTAKLATVAAVWGAARAGASSPRPSEAARIVADIVKRGWAPSYQVEDLIYAQGCRSWVPGGLDTCDAFEVPQQSVFRRPGARAVECIGFREVRAADLAVLLMRMERYGLPVDPAPLVAALLPAIRRQKVVTDADLRVLWFAQERHRSVPVTMAVADARWSVRADQTLTLSTSYRAEAWIEDGTPVRLIMTRPKRGALRAAA